MFILKDHTFLMYSNLISKFHGNIEYTYLYNIYKFINRVLELSWLSGRFLKYLK